MAVTQAETIDVVVIARGDNGDIVLKDQSTGDVYTINVGKQHRFHLKNKPIDKVVGIREGQGDLVYERHFEQHGDFQIDSRDLLTIIAELSQRVKQLEGSKQS